MAKRQIGPPPPQQAAANLAARKQAQMAKVAATNASGLNRIVVSALPGGMKMSIVKSNPQFAALWAVIQQAVAVS